MVLRTPAATAPRTLERQVLFGNDGIQSEEFAPLYQWWNARQDTEQAWKVTVELLRENGFDLAQNHPKHAKVSLPAPRRDYWERSANER